MSDLPRSPAEVVARIDSHRRPRPALHDSLAPPRNPMEAAVAAFWCEVLRLEEVGIHDDFFDIGGDSIHMVRILSRIWKGYGVEVAIEVFFDNPTVACLAHVIQGSLEQKPGSVSGDGSVQQC